MKTSPTPARLRLERRPLAPRRSKGQSLAEFALFAPVLLLVLLVTLDLGRVYLGWVSLNNVARIGANFAAMNPDAWQSGNTAIQLRYRQLMAKDTTGINCTLPGTLPDPTFPDAAPNTYTVGSRVRVDLDCNFRLMTPMLSNLIGDGAGNLPVRSSAVFAIRYGTTGAPPVGGGGSATPSPSPTASPSPTPTSPPTPTPPGETPPPTTPSPAPPVVTFYGTPTSLDSYGGGAPASPPDPNENQIVGIPTLTVTFTNTTNGPRTSCVWSFGDGISSTSCSDTVSHSYSTRGTYSVTLIVDLGILTRTNYVLVGCKVPAFAGARKNAASSMWTDAGFAAANLTELPGIGNYIIGYQSLAGGLVNPPGGCSGATIQVGP